MGGALERINFRGGTRFFGIRGSSLVQIGDKIDGLCLDSCSALCT